MRDRRYIWYCLAATWPLIGVSALVGATGGPWGLGLALSGAAVATGLVGLWLSLADERGGHD